MAHEVGDDDYYDDGRTIDMLSASQEKVLSLLPVFSGLLSAWGSLQIILIIIRHRQRRHSNIGSPMSCYQRTMLGLSVSDLASSIVLSLQAFLQPSSEGRIWAIGNDTTCAVMGFLQQFAGSTIFYNAMLSFVFLLTIRYNVTEARISSIYEPWMHVVSIGFPFVTACIAIPWYGPLEVGQFCWISGENSALIAYVVAGIPYFLIMMIIPTNNAMIYCHARRQTIQKRESAIMMTSLSERQGSTSQDGCSSFSNEQVQQEIQDERRQMARRQDSERRTRKRLHQVAWQAFYYVAAFWITQLPAVLLRVVSNAFQRQREEEASLFFLLVLQAVLWPLQGLFNYLIYTHTTYLVETA